MTGFHVQTRNASTVQNIVICSVQKWNWLNSEGGEETYSINRKQYLICL